MPVYQSDNAFNQYRNLTEVLWLAQHGRISTLASDPFKESLVDVLIELDDIFHPGIVYIKRHQVIDAQHAGLFIRRQLPSITLRTFEKKNYLKCIGHVSSTGASIFTTRPGVSIAQLFETIDKRVIQEALNNADLKQALVKFFEVNFKHALKNEGVYQWMSETFGTHFNRPSSPSVDELKVEMMQEAPDLPVEDIEAAATLVHFMA